MIDFKISPEFKWALRLEKVLSRAAAGMILGLAGVAGVFLLFVSVVFLNNTYLGWASIFLGIFFSVLLYSLFLSHLEQAQSSPLTFSAVKIISPAARAFFLNLAEEEKFLWMLRRFNISKKSFCDKVAEAYAEGDRLPQAQILDEAYQRAVGSNHLHIRYSDILAAIYLLDEKFQKILFDYGLEEQDLREVAYWQRRREKRAEAAAKFWSRENLLSTKGIGKDWSGGFTVMLDKFAQDITSDARINKVPIHLYGRRNEVDLLERMLIRGKGSSNVVLAGPPGVGRHSILRAFAHRINSGQTYGSLRYMRLLAIDSNSVLAGAASLNEVVARIEQMFGEALLAENVILVINDCDAFLDPNPEAGRVNAAEALLPFFQSRLKIIGITTQEGYQSTIGKNPMLAKLFSKLEIREPTDKEVLLILQDEAELFERRSHLFFTHKALKEAVRLAGKLIQNLPNPEKSLEVLQETAVYAATEAGERTVLTEHVQKVVGLRTKVPVEKVEGQEKETLLNLETILHERIIGQEEAIKQISDALRRARSGIRAENRPIGSFLFLGPTGVGKTETAKALAAVYFGDAKKMARYDMSEFQEVHGISRFLGDADAKTGGLLTETIIANPFSLILLDEIEKAHPKILDLFLQVLDEGRLTDALGRAVNFTNTMIIATSNAGASEVREMLKAGQDPSRASEQILDSLQKQGIFRPEFLNRFDAVIIFRSLSEPELVRVATLLLNELNKRLGEKDIQINITPELAEAVARGGWSPEFGARPLRRFIQEHIENYVAKGLLSGEIQRGQNVEINQNML